MVRNRGIRVVLWACVMKGEKRGGWRAIRSIATECTEKQREWGVHKGGVGLLVVL